MIIDNLLRADNGRQITADAASAFSIDTSTTTLVRGPGVSNELGFGVGITAVGTNSGSVKIKVVESSAADLNTAPAIIGEVDLAAADLVAGTSFLIPIPAGKPTARYIGLLYDITGTVDITLDAFLTAKDEFENLQLFAKAYQI
jgi:hypothetical protein